MALLKKFRDGKELEMDDKQELDDKEQVLGDMGLDDMGQGEDASQSNLHKWCLRT